LISGHQKDRDAHAAIFWLLTLELRRIRPLLFQIRGLAQSQGAAEKVGEEVPTI